MVLSVAVRRGRRGLVRGEMSREIGVTELSVGMGAAG